MSFHNHNYSGPFILALLSLVSEKCSLGEATVSVCHTLSSCAKTVGVKASFLSHCKSAALMAFKI